MFGKKKKDQEPEKEIVKEEKGKKKKEEKEKEPMYYRSAVGIQAVNYRVYYLSALERILYSLLAFLGGAVVGFLFYGGIGKDEFGDPTTVTYVMNVIVMVGAGIAAAIIYPPIRQKQILQNRQKKLRHQFRDMLEALTTSLNAGRNIRDSFKAAYTDLGNQYDEGAFIIKELEIINTGMDNGINAEELISDFGARSGCGDIEDFAKVFEISYRKGGNIKNAIRNTYEILSDKMTIAEDIETMVTGSKSELVMMLVLPVILVVLMKYSSADFAKNMTSNTGLVSTTIALVMTVAAYMLGQKILDFNN